MKARPNWNPVNPYDDLSLEWYVPPDEVKVQVFEDVSKSVITRNKSPDLPYEFGLNPYRGCTHACSYCYARRSHEYLGYGAGSDFETRIIVKTKIAEHLDTEFQKSSWKGRTINLSGITDPYQPLEGKYKLTRACLSVCTEYNQPLSIFTRSPLIRRDIDLLSQLAQQNAVYIGILVELLDFF